MIVFFLIVARIGLAAAVTLGLMAVTVSWIFWIPSALALVVGIVFLLNQDLEEPSFSDFLPTSSAKDEPEVTAMNIGPAPINPVNVPSMNFQVYRPPVAPKPKQSSAPPLPQTQPSRTRELGVDIGREKDIFDD